MDIERRTISPQEELKTEVEAPPAALREVIPHTLPSISEEALETAVDSQRLQEEFESMRGLPPDGEVTLYHGMNGGYGAAEELLTSDHKGVEERRGPTLSLTPLAQYWKSGDVGVRYSIPRNLVEFPGETNPSAVVRLGENNVAQILTAEKTLPFTDYKGEILRAPGENLDTEGEHRVAELVSQLQEVQRNVAYINERIAQNPRANLEKLAGDAQMITNEFITRHVRDGIHDTLDGPVGPLSTRELLGTLQVNGKEVENTEAYENKVQIAVDTLTAFVDKLENARDEVVRQRSDVSKKRFALQSIGEVVKKRNPLQWAVGTLNKSFISGLKNEYSSEEELGEVFDAALREKKPQEFLTQEISRRIETTDRQLSRMDELVSLYDKERETYAGMRQELRNGLRLITNAINAVGKTRESA